MKIWIRMSAAVIALGALIVILYWPQKAKPAASAKPLVTVPDAQVQRIAITPAPAAAAATAPTATAAAPAAAAGPAVVLTKSGSDWQLEQPYAFKADGPTVASLLDALGDITGATVVGQASEAAKFGLDHPAIVQLGLANGKSLSFRFGSDNPSGDHVYLQVGSGPIEMVTSDVKDNAVKSAFDLQDKTVVQFPSGQVTAIDLTDQGKTVHVTKVKNAWPAAQKSNVQSLLDGLEDAQMNAMSDVTGQAAAADGLAHPPIVLRLSWNGGSSELDIGNKSGAAEYYARNSASPAIFTISDYLITDMNNVVTPPKPMTVAAPGAAK
jgi:hypothetical protein